MALKMTKPGKTREYVLRADRASQQQTYFDLRLLTHEQIDELEELSPMSAEQAARIAAIMAEAHAAGRAEPTEDEMQRINEVAPMDRAYMRKLLRQCKRAVELGVVRIRGLIDDEGNALEMGAEEFARTAPKTVLFELGTEILRSSKPDEDFIKN